MNTKRRFTYVEMMIVLAVIAFLFSLLVPALIRGKEMAKRAFCINNLDQIAKFAQMYNLDNGELPYSSTWLIDFAFLEKYIDSYGIAECPETDDVVDSVCALTGGTSYHYMGSRYEWEKYNIADGDGTQYGFDATNPSIMNKLNNREEKLLYDKSDTVHYGTFNVYHLESGHYESVRYTDRSDYWFLTAANTLNFHSGDLPDRNDNLNQERLGDSFNEQAADDDDDGDGDGPRPWKVRIIHYPPGNPENQQEIEVGYSAWAAHDAHGDKLLEILYK